MRTPSCLRYSLSALVLVALTSAGCGMVPMPKFLDGHVESGVYTAPGDRFSVVVPQARDDDEYLYLQVKEAHSPQEEYVSFGPAAGDRRIFRINITWWPADGVRATSFDMLAPRVIDAYVAQLQEGYRVAPAVIRIEPDSIGAHRAIVWEAEQEVPEGVFGNSPMKVRHLVWAIDMPVAIACVCVEWYPESWNAKGTPAEARAFAESLVVR